MERRHRYAVAGVALIAPVAAMFWVDVLRGQPASVGLVAVSAASLACAALSDRAHPARAGTLAASGVALASLALNQYVDWLERLDT
jgi:hypothetical protein